MSTDAARRRIVGLYAIADTAYLDDDALPQAVAAVIEGGARVIQYRDKTHDVTRRTRQALMLAALCRQHGVPFLINDDVALAADIHADGVHLGRGDATLAEARARLGAQAIVGVSCYNELERALAAEAAGADYVAFGSFFASRTKPGTVRADLGLLRSARARLHLPLVAIGGITPENGAILIQAGADALAVIEGVFAQPDVRAAAARYARLFD
jgi:thiamine-phosphate pyrophosphorylase